MVERFERFSLALFEISRYWHKLAAEEMARHGLRASHATYLTALLRCEEGLTAPELGRLCGRDKSDVSRTVAILQEKGFVTKEGVNQSLYRGLLKLTGQAEDALAGASDIVAELLSDDAELRKALRALLAKNGSVYTGCNIENAAYTPSNCAERTAFFKAVSEGARRFRAICIVGGMEGKLAGYTAPGGVCRQVMMEFCDAEQFEIILAVSPDDYQIYRLKELLPLGFGPDNLGNPT